MNTYTLGHMHLRGASDGRHVPAGNEVAGNRRNQSGGQHFDGNLVLKRYLEYEPQFYELYQLFRKLVSYSRNIIGNYSLNTIAFVNHHFKHNFLTLFRVNGQNEIVVCFHGKYS